MHGLPRSFLRPSPMQESRLPMIKAVTREKEGQSSEGWREKERVRERAGRRKERKREKERERKEQ